MSTCDGGEGIGQLILDLLVMRWRSTLTYPESGALLDDGGELGEADVHRQVPGLPVGCSKHTQGERRWRRRSRSCFSSGLALTSVYV